MTLDEVLNEALGYFEAFRRMNFTSDQILFGIDATQVFILVRARGREFIAICGQHTSTEEEIRSAWTDKTTWWNAMATDAERKWLWDRCTARRRAVELIVALMAKGMYGSMELLR